jgi:hypothetical protein
MSMERRRSDDREDLDAKKREKGGEAIDREE